MQLLHRRFDRLKNIAVINAVNQVGDDFGVGLALKHVAFGLEHGPQFVVVFNDAVVHERDTAGFAGGVQAGAVAEVRVRVVHGRCAVGGPTRVGNADQAFQVSGLHLFHQLGHPGGAAGAFKPARMHGHAAGVIPPVFEPLKALHQDGDDVAGRDCADDATHKNSLNPTGEKKVKRGLAVTLVVVIQNRLLIFTYFWILISIFIQQEI